MASLDTQMINSTDELIGCISTGGRVKYVFFWGHQKPKTGVSKSCFSQWFQATFTVGGNTFPTAEHYMMHHKALLFGDATIAAAVLEAKSPGEAKSLGRKVTNFSESKWQEHRTEIVERANLEKFGQNRNLKKFLIDTGNRVLVEASPVDRIWGIGMSANDPDIEQPKKWNGLNLLGFSLMSVRAALSV